MIRPTLHLTVGLPAVGKTTLATEIAERDNLLRLTPDDWLVPMVGDPVPEPTRDALEGRMLWTAHQVLRGGLGVVVDFGCWSPEERWAVRAIAEAAGADFELHALHLDEAERRRRARDRYDADPAGNLTMTEADQDRYLTLYTPPTPDEFAGEPLPDPPAGHQSWLHWASWRWPSLPVLDAR